MLQDIGIKLTSDRLWAMLGFGAFLIANQQLGLGVPDEHVTKLAYAVIAFVLGKSWRSTIPGGIAAKALPQLIEMASPAEEPATDPHVEGASER